jgi:HTH-type transcriptional regulator, competence development regulator
MGDKNESGPIPSSPLGKHLAAIRAARKLSLRRVEELSNKQISNPYLNQIEKGKVRQPSPNTLYVLSEIYRASYERMMELAGYIVGSSSGNERSSKLATLSELNLTEGEELQLARYLQFLRASPPSPTNESEAPDSAQSLDEDERQHTPR